MKWDLQKMKIYRENIISKEIECEFYPQIKHKI